MEDSNAFNALIAMIAAQSLAPFVAPFVCGTILVMIGVVRYCLGIQYVKYSTVEDKVLAERVMANLVKTSWSTMSKSDISTLAPGFFVSWKSKCVGWVSEDLAQTQRGSDLNHTISVMCTKTSQSTIEKLESIIDASGKASVFKGTIQTMYGNPWRKLFQIRPTSPSPSISSPEQERLIQELVEQIKHGGAALIYGKPGTGKSMIAELMLELIASESIEPTLVEGYNPTDPGSMFEDVLKKCPPSKTKPLLLLIDEFDGMVRRTEDGSIKQPDDFTVEVTAKDSFAAWLDKVTRIPYVFLICTTNQPEEFWLEKERTYITRPGRFVGRYELKPMDETSATTTFKKACDLYEMKNVEVPDFKSIPMTMAIMSNAFKRCNKDAWKLYRLLGVQPMSGDSVIRMDQLELSKDK